MCEDILQRGEGRRGSQGCGMEHVMRQAQADILLRVVQEVSPPPCCSCGHVFLSSRVRMHQTPSPIAARGEPPVRRAAKREDEGEANSAHPSP